MAIFNKYTQVSQPPDNYDQYGEGDFLVQAWGGTRSTPQTQYSWDAWHISKDGGNTWYYLYPSKGYFKGQELMTVDKTANDNDKTLDYSSTMVFIDSIYFLYKCTSTVATREVSVQIKNQDDEYVRLYQIMRLTASKQSAIIFSKGGGQNSVTPFDGDSQYPLINSFPLPLAQPFHGSIQFLDSAGRDANDDIELQVNGWYAQPKFREYKIRGCKNLCIGRTSNQTLYDGQGQLINVIPLLSKDDKATAVSDPKVWVNK